MLPTRTTALLILTLLALALGCGSPQSRVVGPPEIAPPPQETQWFKPEGLDRMNFSLKWELETKRADFVHMNLQDDALYAVTADHTLYSIDIDKGVLNWIYTIGEPLSFGPVVYKYEQDPESGIEKFDEILLLSGDRLRVVDKDTGELLWKKDLPFATSSPPSGTQGNVVIGSWDDRVYAFSKDAPNGKEWMWRTGGDVLAGGVEYSPLYIGVSSDGEIYAFTQVGGELRWKKRTRGPIVARPVIHQGKLYISSKDYSLYCVDLMESKMQWRFETGGPIERSPVVIGDLVFVIPRDRQLTAVHRLQGKVDGKEYVSGDKAWQVQVGRKNFERATTAKVLCRGRDNVYILNEAKEICAVDLKTGTMRWRAPFGGVSFFATNLNNPGSSAELVAKRSGTIYLGLRNGRFFALKEKSEY